MQVARRIDPGGLWRERKAFQAAMDTRLAKLGRDVAAWVERAAANPTLVANALPSDPAKAKEFQTWLEGQIKDGLLETVDGPMGVGEVPWTDQYVRPVYRKALIDTHGAIKGPLPEGLGGADWLQQAFNGPVAVRSLGHIYNRQYAGLKDITTSMEATLQRTLVNAMAQGKDVKTTARELQKGVGFSRARARTFATTELQHAYAEGQLDSMDALGVNTVNLAVEWLTAGDKKVCPKCQAQAGRTYSTKDARGLIPFHPNCVLPGHYVSGRVLRGIEATYSGEVVEVLTASGHKFTVTSDHPVMTPNGPTKAHLLHDGSELLAYGGQTEATVGGVDEYNSPMLIEDVFKAFGTTGRAMPNFGFNLDAEGHGRYGDVYVVGADGVLGHGVHTHEGEAIEQGDLPLADFCGVCGGGLGEALFGGAVSPYGQVSVREGKGPQVIFTEHTGNHGTSGAPTVGHGLGGFPVGVTNEDGGDKPGGHFPLIEFTRLGPASDLDTTFSEPRPDGIRFNPNFVAELFEAFPNEVLVDEVVSVRKFHYEGPVYDVETVPGYFVTGTGADGKGILVQNCRCCWVPGVPEMVAGALADGQKFIQEYQAEVEHKNALAAAAKLLLTAPNPMKTKSGEFSSDVFFHGTAAEFDKFDAAKIGTGADMGGENWYGRGVYLSGEPWKADAYAAASKGHVYATKVTLKNPLVVNGTGAADWEDTLTRLGIKTRKPSEITEMLKAEGYDGIVVLKSDNSGKVNELVVFDPKKLEVKAKFAAGDTAKNAKPVVYTPNVKPAPVPPPVEPVPVPVPTAKLPAMGNPYDPKKVEAYVAANTDKRGWVRPFVKRDISAEELSLAKKGAKTAGEEVIDIAGLQTTKGGVYGTGIPAWAKNIADDPTLLDMPIVVELPDGTRALVDGDLRVAIALANGDTQIAVKLVKLGAGAAEDLAKAKATAAVVKQSAAEVARDAFAKKLGLAGNASLPLTEGGKFDAGTVTIAFEKLTGIEYSYKNNMAPIVYERLRKAKMMQSAEAQIKELEALAKQIKNMPRRTLYKIGTPRGAALPDMPTPGADLKPLRVEMADKLKHVSTGKSLVENDKGELVRSRDLVLDAMEKRARAMEKQYDKTTKGPKTPAVVKPMATREAVKHSDEVMVATDQKLVDNHDGIAKGYAFLNKVCDKTVLDEAMPEVALVQGRAYASKTGFMALDPFSDASTVIHEYTHHLEYKLSDDGYGKLIEFANKRRGTEALSPIYNRADLADEVGFKDEFHKAVDAVFGESRRTAAHYAGKIYPEYQGRRPTELLTIGAELLYEDPVAFAKADPEWFDLVEGVLSGRIR